jgi:hypothetical protein
MRLAVRCGLLVVLVFVFADFAAALPMKPAACPVPDSGFTVPAGWANYLDIPGLYLLQPPGSKPPGDTIAGSFIGLETSVAPEASDCRSSVNGNARTPRAMSAWVARQSGLVLTNRHAVSLGGLHGVVFDVRMARGAKGCLSAGATKPAVPLLVGVGLSSFDHEVAPGFAERHFLLGYKGGTLDVQVVDATDGKHLAGYAAIVKTFRFQSP